MPKLHLPFWARIAIPRVRKTFKPKFYLRLWARASIKRVRAMSKLLAWLRMQSNFIQAVLFGSITTIVFALLYLWLLQLVQVPATDEGTVLSLRLAIGQVLTGFAALFLTGVLGYFAVREFADQQARPQLQLRLHIPPHGFVNTYTVHIDEGKSGYFIFAIENTGPVLAQWFMIELYLPIFTNWVAEFRDEHSGLAAWQSPFINQTIHSITTLPFTYYWDEKTSVFKIGMSSGGRIAAFPNQPLLIWSFELPYRYVDVPSHFTCDYRIVSDKAKPVLGKIHVSFAAKPSATDA